MEITECEIFCRLCLGSCNDGQHLEGFVSYKLKFILPWIDLGLSSDPRICHDCYRDLVIHYRFKSKCLDSNEPMYNFEKLELLTKTCNAKSLCIEREKQSRCGLCRSENIPRWFAANQAKLLKVMLETCLPDLDDMVSTTCKKCLDGLKDIFRFVSVCMHTEEKIKKYCYFNDPKCGRGIDLKDVLQFIDNKTEEYIVSHQDDEAEEEVEASKEPQEIFIKPEPEVEDNEAVDGVDIDIEEGPDREEIENYGKQLQGEYQEPADKSDITRVQDDHKSVTPKTYKCVSCKYFTKHKSRFYRHKQLYHKYLPKEKHA